MVEYKTGPARMLMWVDAVGGFMVCLDDEIVLGRPSPDSAADVAIMADLSRRHAVIYRDGEGYLIEPLQHVALDGRPLAEVTPLADGNIIQLGPSVELRFRRPHALSATARLEMLSHHRTEPAADAVLMMAESCVLGPAWNSHVVCRDWREEVILFRHGSELCCRTRGRFEVDGRPSDRSCAIRAGSHVAGDYFSFTLEAA